MGLFRFYGLNGNIADIYQYIDKLVVKIHYFSLSTESNKSDSNKIKSNVVYP